MRVGSKDVNADGDGDNIAGHKTVDTTSEAEVVKQEGTTQKIVTSSYYGFVGSRKIYTTIQRSRHPNK